MSRPPATDGTAARGALVVAPERTWRDRRAFVGLPYRLHRGLPGFVPPLRVDERFLGNRRANPFFAHAEVAHFLARRGGRVVGRIAAIENRRHNEVHGERVGFFGRFDVEPDPEAAAALVEAARAWVAARGLTHLRGPVSYSSNESIGVLVEGFPRPPAVGMPWNRDDYDALLLGAGLSKAKDLLAYWVRSDVPLPERVVRIAARTLDRQGYRVRPLDLSRWDEELDRLLDLYNRCWERNWGFVPMTEAEFRHAAKALKFIVDPRIFLFVERAGSGAGGEAVGFVGAVPDVNEILHDLDGRLFPFGLVKLLRRRRRITGSRVMLLGVAPEVRGRGLDAALMVEVFRRAGEAGYRGGEGSWILEDNLRMRKDLEALGATITARYRVYERPA